jgi:hypothetical protein
VHEIGGILARVDGKPTGIGFNLNNKRTTYQLQHRNRGVLGKEDEVCLRYISSAARVLKLKEE